MAILRVIGANADNESYDNQVKYPIVKPKGIALFEGCLPMLDLMGKAHNLFDLGGTRKAIYDILEYLDIKVGVIPSFSCPSTGLLNLNVEGMKDVVSDISKKNLDALKKSKPKKIIISTPEAFVNLSKNKKFGEISSIVDELVDRFKNSNKLKNLELTVALHKACNMENDPFYKTTRDLLNNIPGLKIIELKKRCGHNNFYRIDAKTKMDAVELMREASEKDADIILCTSPYCQSHLLLCSREGSWQSADIEISDIFQIFLKSIKGDS
jgi:Fe-S oxidoreductase